MIAKNRVARQFGRAAASYEEHATVQAHMVRRLMSILASTGACTRILEIGCGPGTLTRQLAAAFPAASIWATDISPDMLAQAQRALGENPQLRFSCQDGEDLRLGEASFDLIVANATFQWFTQPAQAFRQFARHLGDGGLLAYGTFGSSTFCELHAAFSQAYRRAGIAGSFAHGPSFHSAASYGSFADGGGLATLLLEEETVVERFPSVREFLRSVKRVGAGNAAPLHQVATSRPLLTAMLDCYAEAFRLPDGSIPATYHLIYGLHRKTSPDSQGD